MLEKLTISDYRSCIHTLIEFQPDLSVLIGPNGSGKTNILKACLLLRSLAGEAGIRSADSQDSYNETRLKASFLYEKQSAIVTSKLRVLTDENNTDVVLGMHQSWYAKAFTSDAKRVTDPFRYFANHWQRSLFIDDNSELARRRLSMNTAIPEKFLRPLQAISNFLLGIKYYSASQFTDPSQCPVSFEVEQEGPRSRGLRLKGHSRFLYDLYVARSTADYELFLNIIGPDGINLVDKIEFNEIQTSLVEYSVKSGAKVNQKKREKLLVVPQFKIGTNELSPSQLSEGTFKTITLLFYLITERSSALLIEEPEVCVHHGLLASIVELIQQYSKKKQIIISTHSDFVLDQVEPRQVYKVSRDAESGTSVDHIQKSISAKELKALKNYLEMEGNLGEYWRHGGFD